MITVAIHSPNNPDILFSMYQALLICGVPLVMPKWNESSDPRKDSMMRYLYVGKQGPIFYFRKGDAQETLTLTRENFGDVLNFVLLCQIWEE